MKRTDAQMPMNLDSKDLIFIFAINKMKTLDATATFLKKDSSSVFRAIQRIEKSVGKPLFTRSRQGYTPTLTAQLLGEKGELIYQSLTTANDLLFNQHQSFEDVLKITTTDYLLHHSVLPIVQQFSLQHTHVKFEFNIGNSNDKLWERNNDIAIRPTNNPPEQMIGHQLSVLEYAVYGDPGYLENIKARTDRLKWLIFNAKPCKHFNKRWFENTIGSESPTAQFDSMLDLFHAIQAGYGIGLLPCLVTATKKLERYEGFSIQETVPIWMLYHSSSKKRASVESFVQYVLDNKHFFR
jgi:DNA-binding transcriptional LysR family regulator